jgi:hypothetical protein
MAYVTSVTIANRSGSSAEVWVEPWGDFVVVAAGKALRVVAAAEEPGELEVEYGGADGGFTVWAWPGSTVRCYLGDEEPKPGAFSLPVPGVPPGMTTSAFLRLMLGRGDPTGESR